MSLVLNATNTNSTIQTGTELLIAHKAKSQQELEGEMALMLIQSAMVTTDKAPQPQGVSGFTVNIKV